MDIIEFMGRLRIAEGRGMPAMGGEAGFALSRVGC